MSSDAYDNHTDRMDNIPNQLNEIQQTIIELRRQLQLLQLNQTTILEKTQKIEKVSEEIKNTLRYVTRDLSNIKKGLKD
jgi:hypothetical protein